MIEQEKYPVPKTLRESVLQQFGMQNSKMIEKQLASQVGSAHYVTKSIQPWTAMESWMSPEEFEGFLRGNVIKYMARYKDKDGIKDILKAKHYLEKLLECLETRKQDEKT
jgi:hypothetical protein